MEIHPSSLIPHPSDSIAVLLLAFGGPENLDAVEPFIKEIVKKIHEDGIERIIALPMAALNSKASTGGYIDALNKAVEEFSGLNVKVIGAWNRNSFYIQAVADTVKAALAEFPEERRN